MAQLSQDRKEFARLCIVEMRLAAKLCGGKMPDPDWLTAMAEDMASSPALARVPTSRVRELFAHARAHHSETPVLRHLVKSWATISPKAEPTPQDAPKLPPPPELYGAEADLRKLAAIRTCRAEGGQIGFSVATPEGCRDLSSMLKPEPWMEEHLAADPTMAEVEAMVKASTVSTIEFYKRNPELPPFWGHWITHYGLQAKGLR